jgi:uncharacterized tellurite resistance protein B-like protein
MVWSRIKAALAGPSHSSAQETVSVELATAVLLYEMARADFNIAEHEYDTLRELLCEDTALTAEECEELLRRAGDRIGDTVSLHDYVATLNEQLDAEARRRLIRMIWRVAYADGHLDPQEEHLARRLADLLYVPHAVFIQEKLAVTERMHAR